MEQQQPRQERYTIKDIARELGVSVTTVSRAISGKGRIGESTRRRVLDYIAKNNYAPNAIAKSLAQKRTNTIGLVLPSRSAMADMSFFSGCVAGICQTLAGTDFDVMLIMVEDGDYANLNRVLDQGKVDGIILSRGEVEDIPCHILLKRGTPFVLIGGTDLEGVTQVDHDHRAACRELTGVLLDQSRRELALVGGPRRHRVTLDRLRGFLDAYEERGLTVGPGRVYLDVDSGPAADQALDNLIGGGADCVVCMDDMLCSLVLAHLHHRGIRVPQELQVASFYDSFLLENYVPSITSLRFDAAGLGAVACRALLDRLEGGRSPEIQPVGYQIRLRESTGCRGTDWKFSQE